MAWQFVKLTRKDLPMGEVRFEILDDEGYSMRTVSAGYEEACRIASILDAQLAAEKQDGVKASDLLP